MPKIQKHKISYLPLPPLLHVLPPQLTEEAIKRVKTQAQSQGGGEGLKSEEDAGGVNGLNGTVGGATGEGEGAGGGVGRGLVVAGGVIVDSEGKSRIKLRRLRPLEKGSESEKPSAPPNPPISKSNKRKSTSANTAIVEEANERDANGGEEDEEVVEVELAELEEGEVVRILGERRRRVVNGVGLGAGSGVKIENGPGVAAGGQTVGGGGNGRLMVTPGMPTFNPTVNGHGPGLVGALPGNGIGMGRLPAPPSLKSNVNGNGNVNGAHVGSSTSGTTAGIVKPGLMSGPMAIPAPGQNGHHPVQVAVPMANTAAGSAGSGGSDWVEPQVWVIRETGEVFLDYEQYVDRMMFYRQKIFHVETASHQISHLTPMTYFEALKAEAKTSSEAQGAFSNVVKRAILNAAQFSREGRLENLADRIYLRFANRFFENERIFVDLDGDTYFANIAQITHLRSNSASGSSSTSSSSKSSSSHEPHHLALQGEVTQAELDKRDPASDYSYRIQLISQDDVDRNQHFSAAEDGPERWGEQFVEVSADKLSRDRIAFSKIGIKKFLKDSLERDPALYSPWMVLPPLVKKYGIPDQLPEHTRKAIETDRGIATERRKRVWADKVPEEETVVEEGPPSKKQKTEADGEAAPKKKRASKKKDPTKTQQQQEEEEAAEKARLDAENAAEQERLEAERKKKRKPVKFPAEDLLIELTYKEKTNEKPQMRPTFSKNIPFPQHFEMFLGTWNFLNALSKPLGLSPFTIDEFENALYHATAPQACTLLQEVHQVLLNIIRKDVVEAEQPPVLPLKASVAVAPPSTEASASSEDEYDGDEDKEEKVLLVTKYAAGQADTFLAKETGGKAGRKDWENMLIGCLWARGSEHTLPNLLKYLQGMLFDMDPPTNRPTWSAASTRPKISKNIPARYVALHSTFKLEIISFLCELVMQTIHCRDYYEAAIAALSKCRNDQVATKRELNKFTTVEIPAQDADGDVQMEDGSHAASNNGDVEMHNASDDGSEGGSEASGSRHARNKHNAAARQQAMQARTVQKQAEAAARLLQTEQEKADAKAKKAERDEERRLADELARLDREFRRQSNALRTNPLGQDRFCYKVWWLDGCGTVELVNAQHEVSFGTGRIYIQGVAKQELDRAREEDEVTDEELATRRASDEPEDDALGKGDWAVIDSLEQFQQWHFWLNSKGRREGRLLKAIEPFKEVIELQFKSREAQQQVVDQPELDGLLARRQKRGGNVNPYKNKESFLGYKNLYK